MELASDRANFWKCSELIVEIGGDTFRKVIGRVMEERNETFAEYLTNNCCKIFHLLHVDADKTCMDCCKVKKDTDVRCKRLLRRSDCQKLFSTNKSCGKKGIHCCGWEALSDPLLSIDITLGHLLITNLHDLRLPGINLDCLNKIRELRNETFAHATALRMPKQDFDRVWEDASSVIKDAAYVCDTGGRQEIAREIEKLKQCYYHLQDINEEVIIEKLKKLASLRSTRRQTDIDRDGEHSEVTRKQKDLSTSFEHLTEDINLLKTRQIQLVLVGFTKSGISSTTSSITGDETYQGNIFERSTTACEKYVMSIGINTQLHVVDTPGFLSQQSDILNLQLIENFTKDVKSTVLAFVVPLLPPLSAIEDKAEKMLNLFSPDQCIHKSNRRFIVFTFCKVLFSMNIVRKLQEGPQFRKLLNACGGVYVCIDNADSCTVAENAYKIIETTFNSINADIADELREVHGDCSLREEEIFEEIISSIDKEKRKQLCRRRKSIEMKQNEIEIMISEEANAVLADVPEREKRILREAFESFQEQEKEKDNIAVKEQLSCIEFEERRIFHAACKKDHWKLVKHLSEKYPYLLQIDEHEKLPSGKTNEILGQVGEDLDFDSRSSFADMEKTTILHLACKDGNLPLVKFLSESYPTLLLTKDENGMLPLFWAVRTGSMDLVKYFCTKDKYIYHVANNDQTIMHVACQEGNIDLVKYLAENCHALLERKDKNGTFPITAAGLSGSVDLIKYLCFKGCNVYDVDNDGKTILHVACLEGHLDLVKYLAESFPDLLQSKDRNGRSPIIVSGYSGSVDLVKFLFLKSCNAFDVDNDGKTVLHLACQKGHLDLIKYLIESVPDLLQSKDRYGWSPLNQVGFSGSVDLVKYLTSNGSNVFDVDNDGTTVLHAACRSGHIDLVKYLDENFDDSIKTKDTNCRSPIIEIGFSGFVDLVKYLCSKGCNVFDVDKNGMTILHLACQKGHLDLVKYLAESFPKLLHSKDSYGRSPIIESGYSGSVELVKYLSSKDCNVYDVDNDGWTILYMACTKGHLDLVKYLVENFDGLIQTKDTDGRSPIMEIGFHGFVDLVKYLCSKGCNVFDVDNDGKTILHLASEEGHLDLVKYLAESFHDLLQSKDRKERSPIILAGFSGSIDLVKYLSSKGCNVFDVVNHGKTVLHLACKKGHLDLVKYLAEIVPNLLQSKDSDGNSPIVEAGFSGFVDVVKYLALKGCNVLDVDNDGKTMSHIACKKGHIDLVKYLAESVPHLLRSKDSYGRTPIIESGYSGSVDLVKYLSSKGCNVFDIDNDGKTVLHLACQEGHVDLVKYLAEIFPDLLQSKDSYGRTPIIECGYSSSVDLVKYLSSISCNVYDVDNDGWTVLHVACQEGNFDLVKYLAEIFPDLLQSKDSNGRSPIVESGYSGSVDLVKYLSSTDCNVYDVDNDGWTVLHVACQEGNFDLVKYLAESFPDLLQSKDRKDWSTPIIPAGFSGSIDLVKYLSSKGCNVFDVDNHGMTVLHSACLGGHLDLVKYLAESVPDLLQSKDSYGQTPIIESGYSGSVDLVKYLSSIDCNVYDVDNDGETILHLASQEGHLDLVEYLAESFPDLLQLKDSNGRSPIIESGFSGSIDLVKYLSSKGCNVFDIENDGKTVLHLACKKGHLDLVKYLAESVPDLLQSKDSYGRTPIIESGYSGSVDLVKYLSSIDCNVYDVDNKGWTVLHVACQKGQLDLVKYLSSTDCNVYDVDNDGMTVLHVACKEGHLDIVKYLAESFPNLLQLKDSYGRSPIIESAYSCSVDLVKYLCSKGCNVFDVDNDGKTMSHIACKKGHIDLVKYLAESVPHLLRSKGRYGRTPIIESGYSGSVDLVKYLCSNGCNVFDVDNDGKTILHLASGEGHLDLVKYLAESFHDLLQSKDRKENSPIILTGFSGSIDLVKYLSSKGCNVFDIDNDGKTVLHLACQEGHVDLVKYLAEIFPDLLQSKDSFGRTPIIECGYSGSVDLVKYLSSIDCNVYDVDNDGWTVLHVACQEGNFDLVKYLAEIAPNLLQSKDSDGYSPILEACFFGFLDLVKYLSLKGCNVLDVDNDGKTMSHMACMKGHINLVKYLAENFPDLLQSKDSYGRTPIIESGYSGSVDLVKYLSSIDCNVYDVDNDGWTVLHVACQKGNLDLVKYLSSIDCNVYDVDNYDSTVLHVACRAGHIDLVKYLVESFHDLLQSKDRKERSPIILAGYSGSIDLVKYLSSKGCNVFDIDNHDKTVLHLACKKGHLDLVKYLAESFPKLLHSKDSYGSSPIIESGYSGSVDLVKYLSSIDCNVYDADNDGWTVLHVACQEGHLDLVKYLAENFDDLLQNKDKHGRSPIIEIGVHGFVDLVKYLYSKGCNVFDVDNHGKTVLHLASQGGHLDLVKYLVESFHDLLQSKDRKERSPIILAGFSGSIDLVKYLSSKGCDVFDVDNHGKTVLHLACQKGHLDLVKYLAESFPKLLHSKDSYGRSPIIESGYSGSVDLVKYLSSIDCNVYDVDNDGWTVLHVACQEGHLDLVKYLAENFDDLLQNKDKHGRSPIIEIGVHGFVDLVKYLCSKGCNVFDVDNDGKTVLHLASQEGHLDLVKYLVESFHDLLQSKDRKERSPIILAGFSGSIDLVKYLSSKGCDVFDVDNHGKTVLHLASKKGHLDLVKYLAEIFPDLLQSKDSDGNSPIVESGFSGFVDLVKYLALKGCNVLDVDNDGRTMSHIACKEGHIDLVKYLAESFPDLLQSKDSNGRSPIVESGYSGSVDLVKYLSSTDCNVYDVDNDGWTVLHVACQEGHLDLVKYLAESFPDLLQSKDSNGRSPIVESGYSGSVDLVKYLSSTDCNVYDVDNDGWTVLHVACQEGHLDLVKYLAESFPDLLQSKDSNGRSPIVESGYSGSVDLVKYLSSTDCNVYDVDNDGWTVLHVACQEGHLDLVKYLAESFPDLLQSKDSNGRSPIVESGYSGSVDLVKYLSSTDCNVYDVDNDGWTVLHVACQEGNFDLVKYLAESFPDLLQSKDRKDWSSPIIPAGFSGSVDLVKYLLLKGCNVLDVNEYGMTILHFACVNGQVDLVKYLVDSFKVSLSAKDINGTSPMICAGFSGSVDLVKYLSSKSCNVFDVDNDGMTVFHTAISQGHLDLVKHIAENFPELLRLKDSNFSSLIIESGFSGSGDLVKYLSSKGCNVFDVDNNDKTV